MKYFSINELCHSSTAIKFGIENIPEPKIVKNIITLIENILDPIREQFGKPIYITSGYRNITLNKIVGGDKNSQHLFGKAADIRTEDKKDMKLLWDVIVNSGVEYDQLIDEYDLSWIHISWSEEPRKEILRAIKKDGHTSYIKIK